ncbi:hypothetical protein PVAP13_4KG219503 [Panicum virgatum]|uniref:Uncharacterized protein n=1 Tax=Panicum virgatum TaxID=38727 RepID=A0A8T0TP12_PANVG|nr:hypothetical protein PVAP13_4KG219503 [Panicum virgatum]
MSHGRVESLLRYNYQVPSLGNCMMKLSTEAGLMAIIPRAFGSAEDTHFAICHGFWSLAASNYHQLLFLQVLLILCYNLPRSLLMFVVLPRRLNYVLQPSGHLTVSVFSGSVLRPYPLLNEPGSDLTGVVEGFGAGK